MQFANYKFALAYDAYKKKKGELISLAEIVTENDSWVMKRKSKDGSEFEATIIKHYKVQEIKRLAGLVIFKEPTLVVSPTIENGMTAVYEGSMRLPKDRKKVDTVIGEANRATVKVDYIVSMAHKRWYDRAVLDCLELFEVYSDIEASQLEDPDKPQFTDLMDLKPEELEVIKPFMQTINATNDATMLEEYGKGLKEQLTAANASDKAIFVLRNLYQKKLAELNGNNF